MAEGQIDVTVHVAFTDGDRVVKVLSEAGFQDVRTVSSRSLHAPAQLTVTAERAVAVDEQQQRLDLGDVQASLAALGIAFTWATHGHGAGAISSEWLSVINRATNEPTGFKISVANKFEVEQELARIAELTHTRRANLTVTPQPAWLTT
jgi:hypothetical protein